MTASNSPFIMVTGGAGFIGSNIVARLLESGDYTVAVCDRFRDAESGKWRNLAKHAVADLVAPDALFGWLDRHAEDLAAIVHMGAISSTSEPDVDRIVANNYVLSRDIWRFATERRVRLIYASSAATYGGGEGGFADRDDIASLQSLRPLNAYGWSKAMFDIYAARQAARGEAPPQWAGLKFFNVYGPNEYHKGSMKSVLAQIWPKIAAGEPVELFKSHHPDYAHGGQLRDFVYVRDAADAVAWLLESPQVSGIYNLGSGTARSFADLASVAFRAIGREPLIDYVDPPAAIRDAYQYYTQAEMGRLTLAGFDRPFTALEDGVSDYVISYLCRPDRYR